MREEPSIPEALLRACLEEQYDLASISLNFLPLGLDSRAGVYQMVSEGATYFLKARSGPLYKSGCLVPRYLRDQGIVAAIAPLPTRKGALWAQFEDWTIIVYPFINEEPGSRRDMTDENWKEVGAILKQIHGATLPLAGLQDLRQEAFDPTEYSRKIQAIETYQASSLPGNEIEQILRQRWMAHQPTIHMLQDSMEKLAHLLRKQSGPYVICHADLHPANLLRDQAGQMFVIDWDDVMLAPKERDFIFIREASADHSTIRDASPFFQGYGRTEVDRATLTYYLCERVVQDLIVCAQDVFFREDLGAETKAGAAQLFSDIFMEGSVFDAACASLPLLPSSLNIHSPDLTRHKQ